MTETAEKQEVVALQAGADIRAIVPRSIEEVHRLAQGVIKAGLAPDSYDKDPAKVALGIMKSLEVGLPPLTGLNSIAIVNGRPCIWGDGAIALIQNGGHIDSYEVEECGTEPQEGCGPESYPDDYGYVVTIKRKDQSSFYVGKFTVGDAKRAKLWMNHKRPPWIFYPKRMLLNRARAFAMRDGFADALHGLGIREEMEDVPTRAPEAPDVSFLDAETVTDEDTPQALEMPTDEPIEPEVVDPKTGEITTSGNDKPSLPDFDYVASFRSMISGMSAAEIEEFWSKSEQDRKRRSETEQRELATVRLERLKELGK